MNTIDLELITTPYMSVEVSLSVPGPNVIGGYGFSFNNLAPEDVLKFSGAAWVNEPKIFLSDGGNF